MEIFIGLYTVFSCGNNFVVIIIIYLTYSSDFSISCIQFEFSFPTIYCYSLFLVAAVDFYKSTYSIGKLILNNYYATSALAPCTLIL